MKTFPLLILLLMVSLSSVSTAQMREYQLEGIGTISVPDNMELQSDAYRNLVSGSTGMSLNASYTHDRYIFQQSGLNDGDSNAFNKYVRVIITKGSNDAKAEPISLNYKATAEEIQTLNTMLKRGISDDLAPGNVLLGWGGTQLVNSEVNYQSAIETSYLRRYQTNLPVVVFTYSLINGDYVYVITLSCRKERLKYWSPLFNKIFESFRIGGS